MFEKVRELVAAQLGIDEAVIKPESNFKEDLKADSLDLFELVMSLEDECSVTIPSEELEKILQYRMLLIISRLTRNSYKCQEGR